MIDQFNNTCFVSYAALKTSKFPYQDWKWSSLLARPLRSTASSAAECHHQISICSFPKENIRSLSSVPLASVESSKSQRATETAVRTNVPFPSLPLQLHPSQLVSSNGFSLLGVPLNLTCRMKPP